MKKNKKSPMIAFLNRYLISFAKRPLWQTAAVGVLPALLVFYLFYSGLIVPEMSDAVQQRSSLTALETENAAGRAVEAQEGAFNAEFAELVGLLGEAGKLLPAETELSDILAYLQATAFRHNVTITGLNSPSTPAASQIAGKLREREIPVVAVGKFADVQNFFAEVSTLERILVIRDFQIESAKRGQTTALARPEKVSVSFTLLAFHLPPPNEFPALPAGIKRPSAIASR